ncbi:MAG: hypothetical protein JXC35_00730 [Acholeplasmataceae bacterium]|nr:hypothetical protein [Acholeplasmataceae bacterium]
MEEKDLFLPIKSLLENQGFVVKGEVNDIDILAVKDDFMLAVELKTKITLKLIYQAIERFKICEKVYLGIPVEAIKSHQKNMKSFVLLLKRLNLGLIIVKKNRAEVYLDALEYDVKKSKERNQDKKVKTRKEFSLRENTDVLGGTKGIQMTYYREQVIQIAKVIEIHHTASPKMIKSETHIEKTSSILQKNYYGWFKRIERGQYQLSEIGINELKNLSHI